MPRPRTPIGSHGTIHTVELTTGVWRARTLYRGADGKRRQVERVRQGRSAAKAVAALKEAVTSASAGDAEVNSSTLLAKLADRFLQSRREAGRAPRTIESYEYSIRNVITPRLGDLTVAEVTPGRLHQFFVSVTADHGPAASKMARAVLSGMMAIAVRHDALRANPVASVEGTRGRAGAKGAAALPLEEVARFRERVERDVALQRLDLADLLVFMLFTGCRIGEALALRWSHVNLEKHQVTFAATVVRIRGEGLRIQEQAKTAAGVRTITIAPDAVAMLQARPRVADVVFPTVLGKLREPSNTEADWRRHRDRLGYPSITTHSFRKTVATALDVAGLSARAIAEYLGHRRPSMTQDVYMSRNTGSGASAAELSRMFGVSSESSALEAGASL